LQRVGDGEGAGAGEGARAQLDPHRGRDGAVGVDLPAVEAQGAGPGERRAAGQGVVAAAEIEGGARGDVEGPGGRRGVADLQGAGEDVDVLVVVQGDAVEGRGAVARAVEGAVVVEGVGPADVAGEAAAAVGGEDAAGLVVERADLAQRR